MMMLYASTRSLHQVQLRYHTVSNVNNHKTSLTYFGSFICGVIYCYQNPKFKNARLLCGPGEEAKPSLLLGHVVSLDDK